MRQLKFCMLKFNVMQQRILAEDAFSDMWLGNLREREAAKPKRQKTKKWNLLAA